MDPLQAAFVGGWPSDEEDVVVPPLSPRGRDAGPTVVVTDRRETPVAWPSRVVAIPAPRPAFVFPATAYRPAQGQQSQLSGNWTHGTPDKTVQQRDGVMTYSPFSRGRVR